MLLKLVARMLDVDMYSRPDTTEVLELYNSTRLHHDQLSDCDHDYIQNYPGIIDVIS